MMNPEPHTDDWERLLVDYADGNLPSDQAQRIEAHLHKCPDCRALVAALNESLAGARVLWNYRLEEVNSPRLSPGSHRVWIGLAAGVLLVVGLLGWWCGPRSRPTEPLDEVLVQQEVQAWGQAAKLLATAEMLARLEQHHSLAQQQYQYIVDTYPNTPSASLAQAKLDQ